MYKILLDSFSQNPILYIVPKAKVDKYLESFGIKELSSDPKAKDWLYNHQDVVKKLYSKKIKVSIVL